MGQTIDICLFFNNNNYYFIIASISKLTTKSWKYCGSVSTKTNMETRFKQKSVKRFFEETYIRVGAFL